MIVRFVTQTRVQVPLSWGGEFVLRLRNANPPHQKEVYILYFNYLCLWIFVKFYIWNQILFDLYLFVGSKWIFSIAHIINPIHADIHSIKLKYWFMTKKRKVCNMDWLGCVPDSFTLRNLCLTTVVTLLFGFFFGVGAFVMEMSKIPSFFTQ